ncbi:DNA cytosine methyltransferase [Vibrio taketomensis]|uniref:DNA cytosine methyltransferase n=1 Tax=Vibrio taketomensis TaxID=2572923 RepID=UPI0018D77F3E|nr:DNA cytosine methyltransferase [Vibrio taketomensis]
MPRLESNGLRSLSLFSGGGGLDLGFDLAGFEHVASYELIPICKDTLQRNRPEWNVYAGPDEGDVSKLLGNVTKGW